VGEDGLDSGIGGGQLRIFGCNLVDDPGFCCGTANAWTPIGSLLGFLGIGSLLTSDPCTGPICAGNCTVPQCVSCETCCMPDVEVEVSREGETASVITERRTF